MNRRVAQLLAQLGDQGLNLFIAQHKNLIKLGRHVRLDSLHLLDALEPTDFLQSRALGTGTNGYLIIQLASRISVRWDGSYLRISW